MYLQILNNYTKLVLKLNTIIKLIYKYLRIFKYHNLEPLYRWKVPN